MKPEEIEELLEIYGLEAILATGSISLVEVVSIEK